MAKSKVDFKQVLMQHGERIGLGIAALLALGLIATSLFMPGSGVFSGSPDEKAKILEEKANAVQARLSDPNNVPGEADKPSKDSDKKLVALEMKTIDGEKFRLARLVPEDNSGAQGRKVPKVLPIDDAVAKFSHVQIQSYIFDNQDPPRVYALEGPPAGAPGSSGAAGSPAGPGGPPGSVGLSRLGRPGAGAGLAQMLGGGGPGGSMGVPGMTAVGEGETKRDRKVIPVRLTDLDKRTNVTLAEQIRPLRLVVIGASFPYKQQVEEFRTKLGLRSAWEVLSENSTELSPDRQAMSAFRFLGVRVQRRELDGDGNPVGEFQTLDLNRDYVPYIILTGRRFEEDDRELAPLIFPGLVMPRLKQFRAEDVARAAAVPGMAGSPPGVGSPAGSATPGGPMGPEGSGATAMARPLDPDRQQYPAIEKDLPEIKKTIETLKSRNVTAVAAPPTRFTSEGIDIFASRPDAGLPGAPGGPGMPGSPAMMPPGGPGFPRPPMSGGSPEGMAPGSPGMVDPTQQLELPEHCLVRLIDVTVQPGRAYEYRLQLRMANPNYGRRDVASPTYATEKELVSEWSKNPIRVRVPLETRYYVVDQKELEAAENPRNRYEGPYARVPINKDRQIVLQIHRWLDTVPNMGRTPLLVGDWTVAERIPVYRGEYVGRNERVELPVWRYTREEHVIASDSTTGKFRPGIEVNFGLKAGGAQPESILVDFQQGATAYDRVTRRTEENVETKRVTDEYGAEALLLNPDGSLLLLEGGRDAADKEREETLRKVRKRIREVKSKSKPDAGGGATTSPFDT